MTATGEPNPEAVMQQLTITAATCINRRDLVEQVIADCGGGSILKFKFQEDSLPPSWCMYRQGNRIYVCIYGTVNWKQWIGNVVGIFGNRAVVGNTFHQFFLYEWEQIETELRAALPEDKDTCDYFFSGHSMGGAVAGIGARLFKVDFPNRQIAFMGFGNPKFMGKYPLTPPPDINVFVSSRGDAVTRLPPKYLLYIAKNAIKYKAASFISKFVSDDWKHEAKGFFFTTQGEIEAAEDGDFELELNWQLIGTLASGHIIATYMSLSEVAYLKSLTNQPISPVYALSREIRFIPNTQNENVSVALQAFLDTRQINVFDFGTDGSQPITIQNFPEIVSLSGAVLPRGTLPIFSGLTRESVAMPSKITFFYHDNKPGITESFFDSGRGPAAFTGALLKPYLNARMKISGRQTEFDYVRISTVGEKRQVLVLDRTDFPAGTSFKGTYAGTATTDAGSDMASVALLCNKKSGLLTAPIYLGGVPDSIIRNGGDLYASGVYATDFAAWAATVVALGWSWRGVDAQVNPPRQITAAVQNDDGTALLTLADVLFPTQPAGSRVVVRISSVNTPRYMNGQLTVQVKTPTTCQTIVPYPVPGFVPGNGKMSLSSLTYRQITAIYIERAVTRKRGKASRQSVGRAKARLRA